MSSPAQSLPSVPDHEMLRPIGRGSYGDVWLARSVGGRLRAVKVVWRHRFSSERPYEREFNGIRTFEPISRAHPGVIHVLHLGRDEAAGCFYYVMELADAVPGAAEYAPRTLASDLRARERIPVTEALAFGVQLADALGHLHRHRLVHRDVKPSNVIFVEGQAKLADIGLVTGADEARSFVGTEGFIPPEGPGSVQADVFGLGRVLYEATTGKDRCDYPELPDDLHAWGAAEREGLLEMNEILARACAPDAADRYANAAELAGDLNLLLAGRSVRRAHGIERRLRLATRVVGVAVIVALAALGVSWLQTGRVKREAALRERAEQAEATARDKLRESLLHQAQALLGSSEPDRRTRALDSLRQAAAIRTGLDLRNAALSALATPELRVVRRWDPRTASALESTPDARLERYAMRNADGSVSILAVADDAELLRLPSMGRAVHFAVFSPDGASLAVRYDDLSLRVWDLAQRTVRATLPNIRTLVFAPHERTLLALGEDGHVHIVDLASGRSVASVRAPDEGFALAVHTTEPLFATWGYEKPGIEFRRLADGRLERRVDVPAMGLAVGFSADGKQIFTAHHDFSIRVWDWPAMTAPRLLLHLHKAEPVNLATDPESRWLVTGAWDTYAHVVDLRDGRVLLRETSQFVHVAAQRAAFLLSNRGDWRLVEFDPGREFETIVAHERDKGPRDLAFHRSGRFIATAGPDGVRLLDRASGRVRTLTEEGTLRVRFNRDGTRLHAVSPSSLQAWSVRTHDEGGLDLDALDLPSRSTPPFDGVQTAGVTADGEEWLAVRRTANGDPSWIRGRFDSVDEVDSPIPFNRGGTAPEVSADGRWLAWGTWGAERAGVTVRRLGSPDSEEPPTWFPGSGAATTAFSPDTRVLAVGDSEQVRLYEVGTWRLLHAFPRRPIQPLPPQFAFSSDGRLCAATLPPDRVLLLDTVRGEELATLPAAPHIVSRAAFSPDDRTLAAASTDHHVLLWDLEQTRGRLKELGLDW